MSKSAAPLRVVILSGIFPPDVGGPATHAASVQQELERRGHRAWVLTLTDGEPSADAGVVRVRRGRSPIGRLRRVSRVLRERVDDIDVVYATGLHVEAAFGARRIGRPLALKIVGDPVWERARRMGRTELDFDEFQEAPPSGALVRALTALRDWSLRRADLVITPSQFLAGVVERWVPERKVVVIPNGVRAHTSRSDEGSRPAGSLHAIYAGRLVEHKNVALVIEAVAALDGVALEIVGDGPDRERLADLASAAGAGQRVTFTGSVSHDEVLARLTRADVFVNPSQYEGLPHTAIEALACGTPLLVSDAGGFGAVVDDTNGIVVPAADAGGYRDALRRLRDDLDERSRLSSGARHSARSWTLDATVDRIEATLRTLRDRHRERPAVVWYGRGALAGARSGDLERKFAIIDDHVESFVVTSTPTCDVPAAVNAVRLPALRPRVASSALFYSAGAVAAVATARRRDAVVVCQSPFEAAAVQAVRQTMRPRRRPRLVVEVHGDWRASTRLYGGGLRRRIAPVADRAASWSLRRADRIRVIGDFTEQLVRNEHVAARIDRFMTYTDIDVFLEPPLLDPPTAPRAVYIGALERTKGIDVLLDAWMIVSDKVEGSVLRVIGQGTLGGEVARRASDPESGIEVVGQLPRAMLSNEIDAASVLVVPSRSEGLGRVVLEAQARGRAVVASRVGGLPELVTDEVDGLLVPPDDRDALAEAIVRLLVDPVRAAAMGSAGRAQAERPHADRDFAAGVQRLAAWAVPRSR